MRALIPEFNAAILAMAPSHIARPIAPSTYAELVQSPGIVWDGASDATIYGDARINHAFRAWHDHCHVLGNHDFSLAGERAAADLQCAQLLALYPRAPSAWLRLIHAEVTGQVEYFAVNGVFPLDQLKFVTQYVSAT